jgi:hypothetical protein
MSREPILLVFIFLVIVSCNPQLEKKKNEKDSAKIIETLEQRKIDEIAIVKIEPYPEIESYHNSSSFDTISTISVDDYPVTNSMFKSAKYLEEPLLRFDGVWFSCGNQTLAFALYTDYHRYAIFHFRDDLIPVDLIDKMELNKLFPYTDLADLNLKIELFPKVFPKINEVGSSYFISKKGFQLDDSKTKAIEEYGQPDSIKYDNGVEMLYWEFIGDTFYNGTQDLDGKPLAKNSFGHQVRMYFKNG